MNGNLFKIVLISVIAILLAIIGGVMSADGDPVSIALAISPFALAGLLLMKEKVWYLWILFPILFIPFPLLKDYSLLLIYSATIPFYLWNVLLKRSSLTWNSIPLLDVVILMMFLHVGYIFLTHPFGLGVNILNDYYGGKGYILFLQALLAYLCFSSLKTNSRELGKVLQWSVFLTIVFTLITTAKNIISPDSAGLDPATASGNVSEENMRNASFLPLSQLVLLLLILNYSVWQMLKRPWWIILAGIAAVGVMISGFRSAIAYLLLLFFTVSFLYRRWFFCIVAPLLGLLALIIMSSAGMLHSLPFSIQRTLSAVPFLDVSVQAKSDAEGSINWRLEMWEWALDDREHFIQDKVFGDGFSRNINIVKANIYEEAYNLSHDQTSFAWNGLWHSGPISTIQTLGYIGLSLYFILSIIGMTYAWIVSRIYCHHEYRLGILYVSTLYFISPISFFVIFGDSIYIAHNIVSLSVIKALFSCAKREGLYISPYARREYMPLIIQKTVEKKQTDEIPVISS
ncbi:O-antigen ligase family protein [Akkermansia sp.]|uniref:O-antigen ligase family protein n=1 Tax=Akkermansia sp. TaxID=1872421 RepID=UPI0025BA3387|nr:O-antigen ligase family protein [Akkermansia sp.]MCC8148367.1 O-antigen ligase family protein [Akkermansia sp.]